MNTILLRRCRYADLENRVWRDADIRIKDGRIDAIGESLPIEPPALQSYDLQGALVVPGLVDLLASLRQPGFEYKGTLETELSAAVRGGVTSVCCTPLTQPVNDTAAVTRLILDLSEEVDLAQVYPLGALTRRLEGEKLSEMFALREAGCIALTNVREPFVDHAIARRCLEYACSHGIRVLVSPENRSLARGGCVHEGAVASRLGLAGVPASAETLAVSQWLMLVEDTGARVHLGPLSCGQSIELVTAARKKGLPVTSSVALANLMFDESRIDQYDSRFHVRPPLRAASDREALLDAVRSGDIDCIVSNHEPHEVAAGLAPFAETQAGMSQLQLFSSQLLMLAADERDLLTLIDAASRRAAAVVGLDRGVLKPGTVADLAVIDRDQSWQVDAAEWASGGKNTPWLNAEVRGLVTMTFVSGRMVYAHR